MGAKVGTWVELLDGTALGELVTGASVGKADGAWVGVNVGAAVGADEGAEEGNALGASVGVSEGAGEGTSVGPANRTNVNREQTPGNQTISLLPEGANTPTNCKENPA